MSSTMIDAEEWTTDHIGRVLALSSLSPSRLLADTVYKNRYDDWRKLYHGIGQNAGYALQVKNMGGGLCQITNLLRKG